MLCIAKHVLKFPQAGLYLFQAANKWVGAEEGSGRLRWITALAL